MSCSYNSDWFKGCKELEVEFNVFGEFGSWLQIDFFDLIRIRIYLLDK